jgi:hypothetical protein
MKDYNKQATDFLEKTNTTIDKVFSHNGKHFENDEQVKNIYTITIKRGNKQFSFNFGQSIMNSQYYQDRIPDRTYSLDGKSRTGRYSINDIAKYKNSFGDFNGLKIIKGQIPTDYDILTCLTKYNPGTLQDFCSEFGYDIDSKSAEKTYLAIKEEWKNVQTIWTDKEIELLIEIE